MNIRARSRYAVSQVMNILNNRYNSGAMPIIAVVDTFVSTMLVVMLLKYLGVVIAWHEVFTAVVLADVVVLALIALAVNARKQVSVAVSYCSPCPCGCGCDDSDDNDDCEDNEDVDDMEPTSATESTSGSEPAYKPEDAEKINVEKKD